MHLFSFLQYLLLIIFLFKPINNSNGNCIMHTHNFFLLPLEKKNNGNNLELEGLKKYDYMLILKTDPKNIDKYHMVLNVSFPINVNIDLSCEIIYDFISLKKFCINDLVQENKGKYVNILGKLSEYETENQILGKIWIKVEKVLFYKEIEQSNKMTTFYLLTKFSEYDKINKEYILMKKMSNDKSQIFQIVKAYIMKKKDSSTNNYVCAGEYNDEYDLPIGNEFTTFESDDNRLREKLSYNFFSQKINYYFTISKNLVCITYNINKYEDKC